MYPHSSNIGFPSLDDEVASLMSYRLNLTACDVPLPPNPKPAVLDKSKTREKKYPDQKTIGFPSLDVEVASFTTQPLGVMACDIPLPPSTPPIEVVLYMLHCHEKILKSIGFRSLDENIDPKRPNVLPHEIPLPPLDSGDTNKKKNPDWQNIGFPSLDDDIEPSKQRPKPMTKEVPLPLSTDAVFKKGNTDVDSLQQRQVSLPPPTDTGFYKWNNGAKKHQNGQRIMFPSVDDDIEQRHMGFTRQKEQPDLMNFSFSVPDVDPVTLCPPPVRMPHNAKEKYRDLCAVAFPCLD
ncbi:Ankyrin repeat protein G3R [Dissostichus eleginoides]|uniref:Ankyrin repeat protein G3R n=1 Tax=Dissostichus eleginoides TaxID=100907 RepID=A0AAD9C9L8_DISEL|nr:Ankyrin repeat protein G3R [Dissostichus eleginoides]